MIKTHTARLDYNVVYQAYFFTKRCRHDTVVWAHVIALITK